MIHSKHKYHLRKEVYFVVAFAFLVASILSILIINGKKMESSNVESKAVESGLQKDETESFFLKDKYVNMLNDNLKNRQRDNTVKYYASKFKLDVDKALELVHNYTNNYTDESFLQNYVIGPDKVKERMKSFPSEEAGIVYFIRDLYRWPENYGLTIGDVRLSEECSITRNISDGKIIMSDGLTYEQYVARISNLYNLNPKIILAISYLETGYLQSGLFVYNNNVGGMKGYEGWMEFTTLDAGIIAHVLAVKAIADNYGIDLNSDTAIAELSSVYVKGYYGSYDAHWTEKVTTIFNNINDEDLQY